VSSKYSLKPLTKAFANVSDLSVGENALCTSVIVLVRLYINPTFRKLSSARGVPQIEVAPDIDRGKSNHFTMTNDNGPTKKTGLLNQSIANR
jgi:hypothetical protein